MTRPAARALPALLLIALLAAPLAAGAQGAPAPGESDEESPTPYDGSLARLAELLGSLHYLRPLCGAAGEDWRREMEAVLEADTASEPKRRARLVAAFNRGYRAFAAMHTACTAAAAEAERRHRAEAATLIGEMTSRFGR